jgi:SAM-dependent methyltransferase
MDATYDAIAQEFAASRIRDFWAEEFRTFRSLLPAGRILDVGCGSGRDARMFVDADYDYVGFDRSPQMIAVCRKTVPEGTFAEADFSAIDLPPGGFDGFWAAASLLHISRADLPQFLGRLAQAIRPGGVGFISMKPWRGTDEEVVPDRRHGDRRRYFAYYPPLVFTSLLLEAGLRLHARHVKYDPTEKKEWECYFVRRLSAG